MVLQNTMYVGWMLIFCSQLYICNGLIRGTTPLFEALLNDYNVLVKPRYNVSDTINVTVSFTLYSLSGIDEKNQRLTFTGWYSFNWTDDFLVWNQSEYGVNIITVPIDRIWTPDIQIWNAVTDFGPIEQAPSRGIVHSGGRVDWYPGSKYSTYCKLNIRHFPFDTQTCRMIVGLWSSMLNGVTLEGNNPNFLPSFEENSEWQIVYFKYSGVTPEYTLEYTLLIKRRYTFYILTMILPIVILSVLTNFVYLLPVESGEKVSLSISVLLSYTVLITLMADLLPSNSDNVCLLAVYLTCFVILSALSTLSTVLVLNYHQRGEQAKVNKESDPLAAMKDIEFKRCAKHLNLGSFVFCMLSTCLIHVVYFGMISSEIGF